MKRNGKNSGSEREHREGGEISEVFEVMKHKYEFHSDLGGMTFQFYFNFTFVETSNL